MTFTTRSLFIIVFIIAGCLGLISWFGMRGALLSVLIVAVGAFHVGRQKRNRLFTAFGIGLFVIALAAVCYDVSGTETWSGAAPVRFQVIVIDAATNKPIPNAEVAEINDGRLFSTATCDERGVWKYDQMWPIGYEQSRLGISRPPRPIKTSFRHVKLWFHAEGYDETTVALPKVTKVNYIDGTNFDLDSVEIKLVPK